MHNGPLCEHQHGIGGGFVIARCWSSLRPLQSVIASAARQSASGFPYAIQSSRPLRLPVELPNPVVKARNAGPMGDGD